MITPYVENSDAISLSIFSLISSYFSVFPVTHIALTNAISGIDIFREVLFLNLIDLYHSRKLSFLLYRLYTVKSFP